MSKNPINTWTIQLTYRSKSISLPPFGPALRIRQSVKALICLAGLDKSVSEKKIGGAHRSRE